MRPRSIAVGTATLIAAASMTPVVASAASQNTLYVNSSNTNCDDSGNGTVDAPFCSITAAAAAAQPGDTVNITAGSGYTGTRIAASGTAAAPIVFTGNGTVNLFGPTGGASLSGLDLSGASNVEIENLSILPVSGGDSAVVDGGSDITFADIAFIAPPAGADALHVTDSAASVTVRDSLVPGEVVVDGGATGTILTTNQITAGYSTAVSIVGADSTAVTSNNISGCAPVVSVTGSSSGTRIENNLVRDGGTQCNTPPEPYGLLVDASSADSTMADYNDVYANGNAAYDWNGVAYTTALSLYDAVQQGQHDNNTLAGVTPGEGSPVINSADSGAVGEQPVDFRGQARYLDPLDKPTGAGPYDYYDRGALQYQDPVTPITRSVTDSPSATKIPVGAPITLNAAVTDTWSDTFTYTFMSGNLTLAAGTNGSYSTSFSTPGTYTIAVYATPTNGAARAATSFASITINVVPVAPLTPGMSVTSDGSARGVIASDAGTTDDWNIAKVGFDFGDGSVVHYVFTDGGQVQHLYATAGTYVVTETVTDADGNTATFSKSVTTEAPAAGTVSSSYIAADGAWAQGFDSSHLPGSGITQVSETGMPNGTLQALGVTSDGVLEFASRTANVPGANGVWSGWTVVSQPGDVVTDASIAGMPDGSSQLIEVTSTGVLKHDVRNANGTWQAVGWSSPAGSTGFKQAAITAMPNGDSQLVAVTTSGVLKHDIRFANHSWQGWDVVNEPGVVVTEASIAGAPDGSSQLVEVTSTGVLKHDIRLATGKWQVYGWGSPAGSTGVEQASIAVLPNGSSEILAVADGGTVESNRRNSAGKWTGWSEPGLEEFLGSETSVSVTRLSDGSAPFLVVDGG